MPWPWTLPCSAPESAVSLLTSRIGGATAIELRRLRQSLRREELLGGGGRTSDVLLVEALLDPASAATLGIEGHSARRIARMIQAGRDARRGPRRQRRDGTVGALASTGLASRWTDAALAGGSAGARADRDLDAMMALFHTAERFVDQLPGSGPEQFLEYLLSQELPMDTLAARAQLEDAVELMTPASAAGRGWPVVIVPGLQEGVWPNTRLRGELLGSTLFADAVEHGVEYALRAGSAAAGCAKSAMTNSGAFPPQCPAPERGADLHGGVLGGRAAVLVPGLCGAVAARAGPPAALPRSSVR